MQSSINESNMLDCQTEVLQTLNKLVAYELTDMLIKYPFLKNSWDAFVVNYNICLSEKELSNDY